MGAIGDQGGIVLSYRPVGGIDALESIPELLKSLKIWNQTKFHEVG